MVLQTYFPAGNYRSRPALLCQQGPTLSRHVLFPNSAPVTALCCQVMAKLMSHLPEILDLCVLISISLLACCSPYSHPPHSQKSTSMI